MDPITVIVGALAAGAVAGLKPTAEQAIKDAYAGLKALILARYRGAAPALDQLEQAPESKARRAVVEEDLGTTDAPRDAELLRAAQALLAALERDAPEAGRTIGVDLQDLKAQSVKLADILAQGADSATGVHIKGADVDGDLTITGVSVVAGPGAAGAVRSPAKDPSRTEWLGRVGTEPMTPPVETVAPASSEGQPASPSGGRETKGFTRAIRPKQAVFHFALNGEHVRGPAVLAGTEAVLSFNYGVPGPSALQSVSSAPLDAARLADTDIMLDVSTTGSIVLKGERRGTAKFRDGRMQETAEFTLLADTAGAGHIHVAFSVKGETVHQSDLDVQVVASQPELDRVPLPDSGAATVPEALAEEIAGAAPPPKQRIKLSLSYDGGKFCIDLEDLNNGETDFVDRFVSKDIDKSKLDTLLKAVRAELAPCYASTDFWRVFDGNSAAAAAPAARRALRRTLETVASAGWMLYSRVASDAKIAEALQYIETNGRIGATLTIGTDDIFLPWEIVYGAFYSRNMTEQQKQETPLQPARFWGTRFAIETLQRGGNVSLGKLRAAHRQAAAKVSISLNPTIVLDKVEDEAQPLALLRKWGKQLSDDGYLEDIHDECGRIRRVLQEAVVNAKILYVYCHGGAPSPATGASEFLQLDADCELRPCDLDPKVRFDSAPIIVLNACQAGAISPVTLSNFLREFRERGALGLISATGSIPILFGERFGEELVQGCLNRKGNLASAVLALRKEHVLNRGNAVPLLYSVQCQI